MTKTKKTCHDYIMLISNNAITRLAYTAGVRELSNSSYDIIRSVIMVKSRDIIQKTISIMDHLHKHTIQVDMIDYALSLENMTMIEQPSDIKCPIPKYTNCKKSRKRGETAILNIKYYQNQSGCLQVSKSGFRKYILCEIQYYKTKPRISHDAIIKLQAVMETYIIKLLTQSQMIAVHAKRIGVTIRDIQLARVLRLLN